MTVEFLPLEAVEVSERQRKNFDLAKLIELADDIALHGLLHAPVLRTHTNQLVAGERRLRAMEMLHDTERQFHYANQPVPYGHIPVTRAHDRDGLGWMEAELSENLARVDLSWQERSHAIATLQRLRQSQTPTWRERDTIEEVKARSSTPRSADALREELRVAQHLDDPDVAKAKSIQEARKIIDRKAQMRRARELGERFDLSAAAACPHTAIHGNALEELVRLQSESFDVLLTDPPYGIGAQDFGSMNILGHAYDDSMETWINLISLLAVESFRVCKPQAHAYVFCDISRWTPLAGEFRLAGWTVWPRPLIWSKGNGMLPRPGFGPRYTYEAIMFASKGDRKVLIDGLADVIAVPLVSRDRIHGAEKPVSLYLDLLRRSVMPGAQVLDPFMGSGTVFPACNLSKCIATGIELDSTYFGLAVSRLEGTQ